MFTDEWLKPADTHCSLSNACSEQNVQEDLYLKFKTFQGLLEEIVNLEIVAISLRNIYEHIESLPRENTFSTELWHTAEYWHWTRLEVSTPFKILLRFSHIHIPLNHQNRKLETKSAGDLFHLYNYPEKQSIAF